MIIAKHPNNVSLEQNKKNLSQSNKHLPGAATFELMEGLF